MPTSTGLLNVFPVEIIEKILDQFSRPIPSTFSPCETCTHVACECNGIIHRFQSYYLAKLARICRPLNTPATPYLYRFPKLYSADEAFLLARTLTARPDLARFVKILQIPMHGTEFGTKR